jgi:quinol monooxygenase YgiN
LYRNTPVATPAFESSPKEDCMVIVAGAFEVDPEQREAFLAGRLDGMRASRAEAGCLEYTLSADPLDPGRVVLFERWADQASLDAHLAAMQGAPPPPAGGVAPTSASITVYDVSGERSLTG